VKRLSTFSRVFFLFSLAFTAPWIQKQRVVPFEYSISAMVDKSTTTEDIRWDTRSVTSTDAPSVCLSDISDDFSEGEESSSRKRLPLQWEFHGLTLWLELEEFNHDLTKAIDRASQRYGTEEIPRAHVTAVYGMEHLTEPDAKQKLYQIPQVLGGSWPTMSPPVGIKQDIAQAGRPGQGKNRFVWVVLSDSSRCNTGLLILSLSYTKVPTNSFQFLSITVCSIAWAELTFPTNEEQEEALDKLYHLFELAPRKKGEHWHPHVSMCYDNPEDTVLNLTDFILYAAQHPTLLTNSRKVKAISLWRTEGKLAHWKCLDRVHF
jgi:hypothetical protein